MLLQILKCVNFVIFSKVFKHVLVINNIIYIYIYIYILEKWKFSLTQ
ncbi:hypothetical protein ACMBCN_02560 [Candidatus Liberibacter asiaticus]|nr:hypothetical protein [Candidatus Liberibacter asiaticus]